MSNITTAVLHQVLDVLEAQENALLVWGDTGGFFNEEELLTLIRQALCNIFKRDPTDAECDETLLAMLNTAMLIQVPHPHNLTVWRTRMGESVHLFRNLRQWFLGKSLEESRTLVSDYRFIRQQRTYPDRVELPEKLISQWQDTLKLTPRMCDIMRHALASKSTFKLSGFQVEATKRILQSWRRHRKGVDAASGTIVCAGTGSGKTLAFYLPAITSLAEDICQDPHARVRILAIYPRKELLKDQFAETFAQCRKLDAYLQQNGTRKIRIGAYFGDTPMRPDDALEKLKGKSALPFGLMKCQQRTPSDDECGGELVWRKVDMQDHREVLICSHCQHQIDSSEVVLTRNAQQQKGMAPDILFTTTEMLNLQMNNGWCNHLFGVGYQQGPTLILLDEVHTYGGTTGAQTALLLRRWMQRTSCLPHFVGLSATLADGRNFFAQLIGATAENVDLIEPKAGEMKAEGAEYLLALRGDPVSETALLSTTIQASMLLSRLLDAQSNKSKGTWGKKTFIFTDTLDGNNRLYHQLSDAEGWKTTSKQSLRVKAPLASLRQSLNGDINHKTELGQNWRVAEEIGHDLEANKIISRTSSQDAGVDARADIVVATASLEVGYNDPEVGAVIQHKAPNDVASYLQRKGRAGRQRGMRPWMLVVLSAFGRDRVEFQRYENLVSPEIKRQGLPLGNQHIQKMQAAMATLDWLSKTGNIKDVAGVLRKPQKNLRYLDALQTSIEEILRGGRKQNELTRYLGDALQYSDDIIQMLLWSPPRSIMLEFLPTILRNLKTRWAVNGVEWAGLKPQGHERGSSPVPEYIPQNLFSELNLPELDIRLLRGHADYDKWENLPFWQGLREFAPGRLSKRYAIDSNTSTDWLVPENFTPVAGGGLEQVPFAIQEAFGDNWIAECQIEHQGKMIDIIKPSWVLTTRADVDRLSDKSNAQLQWQLEILNPGIAIPNEVPAGAWKPALKDITFFNHQHMTPLELVRFNTGAHASFRFKNKSRAHTDFQWVSDGKRVGVGSRQWVDGVRLRFEITHETVNRVLNQQEILSGLRPVYFLHAVSQLPEFEFDSFNAAWVAECFQAMLAELLATGRYASVASALDYMASANGMARLQNIPSSLFQPDNDAESGNEQPLQSNLKEMLGDVAIQQALLGCAGVFCKPIEEVDGFIDWARQVLADTLSAGIHQTLCCLLPDINERSVVTDSLWVDDLQSGKQLLEIWLCEMESGGSGVLIRLQEAWFDDPVRFLNVMVRNLSAGDYEQIDFDLRALLAEIQQDEQLRDAVMQVREAENYDARREANKHLHYQLTRKGFRISHSFTTVLYSRILRPGSDEGTDEQLHALLSDWVDLEAAAGIEFNLNIMAHALAVKASGFTSDSQAVFQAQCRNQNLLWPRGYTIRQAELSFYNQFSSRALTTERLLAAALFNDHVQQIDAISHDWLTVLHQALCLAGRAELVLKREDMHHLHSLITTVQVEPVDYLGLLLYPRLGEVRRQQDSVILRIELAEALQ